MFGLCSSTTLCLTGLVPRGYPRSHRVLGFPPGRKVLFVPVAKLGERATGDDTVTQLLCPFGTVALQSGQVNVLKDDLGHAEIVKIRRLQRGERNRNW